MSEDQKHPESGAAETVAPAAESHVSYQQTVDDPYGYGYDPYAATQPGSADVPASNLPATLPAKSEPPPPPPPAGTSSEEEEDDADDGMLRMSFLEHLEELRSRLMKMLGGLGVAFVLSIFFANDLWKVISDPAAVALKSLGFDPNLAQITPMDAFTTIWVKVPLLTSVFLASPWILYQVWAFIAPGLYKKERRWAGPFVIVSAGLFIAG